MQALQQFVNQSPWDPLPVRQRIAERLSRVVRPEVCVIDDVSFPKCGKASVGVARQYCGAVGKRANCQVAVSVHAATDTASCPLLGSRICRGSGRRSPTAAAGQASPRT
ncbi:hypothetical protein SALBM135S_06194 [Streptomyces alboniger]